LKSSLSRRAHRSPLALGRRDAAGLRWIGDHASGRDPFEPHLAPLASLESAGKTLAAALQVPSDRIEARISAGKVVSGALV
jgi:hypothetical protein